MNSFRLAFHKGHWTLFKEGDEAFSFAFCNKPKIEALMMTLEKIGHEQGQLSLFTQRGQLTEVIQLPCTELPKGTTAVRSFIHKPLSPKIDTSAGPIQHP